MTRSAINPMREYASIKSVNRYTLLNISAKAVQLNDMEYLTAFQRLTKEFEQN